MTADAPTGSPTKFLLDESQLPTHWYNLVADLPEPPAPYLHPATREPVGPADLAPLFPMALIAQEVSTERYVPIPEEVREVYRLWRPSPLYRAHRLEQALGTPARIYYKYEGVSPSGSHKSNTSVAQAYYNAQEGVRRLTTETGAGQWGTALALACAMFEHGVRGLAGPGVVRLEAVSPGDDRDVRRHGAPQPVGPDARPAARSSPGTRTPPAAWAWRSARRRRRRPPARTRITRSAAC